MGIPQRHVNRLVSHERLNRSEIDPSHNQSGCKSVAQVVKMKVLDINSPNRVVKDSGHEFIGFSVAVQENPG
jgi:hypothetical protein